METKDDFQFYSDIHSIFASPRLPASLATPRMSSAIEFLFVSENLVERVNSFLKQGSCVRGVNENPYPRPSNKSENTQVSVSLQRVVRSL